MPELAPTIAPPAYPTIMPPPVTPAPPESPGADTWTKLRPKLEQLITAWERMPQTGNQAQDRYNFHDPWQNAGEREKVRVRRELRYNRVNVEQKRMEKKILPDETIITDHTIASNLQREKSPYVQYLTQSRRLLIFKPKKFDPVQRGLEDNVRNLELTFTRGMRYNRWLNPWFRGLDGTLLHGENKFEVMFDESKPLNVGIEFITRDNLLHPLGAKNLQSCEFLMRKYVMFAHEIEALGQEKGFKPAEVKNVVDKIKDDNSAKQTDIYKVFFKLAGIVQIAWFAQGATSGWLKDPVPYQCGIFDIDKDVAERLGYSPEAINAANKAAIAAGQPPIVVPQPLKIFPIFSLQYEMTEEEEILRSQGIASRDLSVQEACTNLLSSLVNGANRASKLMFSRKPNPAAGEAPSGKTMDAIEHGKFIDRELDAAQLPYPNTMMMGLIQMLGTRNSQQAGQVDFAALTRADTEKTATEINAAQSERQALSGTNVSIFSTTIQEIYTFCWLIASSQAKIGQVYLVPPQDNLLLYVDYILTAAGDVEVIERAEKLERMMSAWPIIEKSPLVEQFLKLFVELAFPDEAEGMIQSLDKEGQLTDLLVGLVHILTQVAPQLQKCLPPNAIAAIQSIIQNAQAVVAGPIDQNASGGTPQAQGQTAPSSNAQGRQPPTGSGPA